MGHVSRCIGLIHSLIAQKNTVFIACSADQREIFEAYFDDLQYINHAGYPFNFRGKGMFSMDLLMRFRSLSKRRKQELQETHDYVNEYSIDLVISDHRYGFRSDSVPSIFVTHQLNLPVLWYELPIQGMHRRLMKKFSKIWVLDYSDHRLAGRLSANDALHTVEYIGPYSRFQWYDFEVEQSFEKVVLASGPRVYAQQFINEITLDEVDPQTVFVVNDDIDVPEGLNVIKGDWLQKDSILRAAKHIVTRSGYSTFMDAQYLKATMEYFPTPGQREQEYLFQLHEAKKASIH